MKLSTKQLAIVLVDMAEQEEDLEKVTAAFVEYLAEQNILAKLSDIMRSIDTVWKERYGAATVTITTAHSLSTKLKKEIEKMAKGAGVSEIVDESLIGGARIRIDDRIVDGSISGHLSNLKQALTEI